MATATFVQEGSAVDYTPSSAVAAGNVVVQGDLKNA
jgi:predicted RecA/RadA family phage recombinase